MEAWSITDRGLVRRINEDSCYLCVDNEKSLALCAVCDGMGGAKAGNIASKMAIDLFTEAVQSRLQPEFTSGEIKELMREALFEANYEIYEKSVSGNLYSGMGTTIVAAAVTNGAAVVLNVGDSRAYKLSGNGISRITRDHSVVEELVARGDITREEAKHHPNKNIITRAIGTAPAMLCDFFDVELKEGDLLLLCSDGLTNSVDEEDILEIINESEDKSSCCEVLLRRSYAHGASDNVTIILLKR